MKKKVNDTKMLKKLRKALGLMSTYVDTRSSHLEKVLQGKKHQLESLEQGSEIVKSHWKMFL